MLASLGTIEDGAYGAEIEDVRRPPEVGLQHLADVHAAGDADGVEDDVDRRAVGEVGHVLGAGGSRQMTPLLPWRPAILSPSESLRRWAMPTRTSLLTPAAMASWSSRIEDLDVDDLAALAVGDAKAGVLHLASLFAKDSAEELLLGG